MTKITIFHKMKKFATHLVSKLHHTIYKYDIFLLSCLTINCPPNDQLNWAVTLHRNYGQWIWIFWGLMMQYLHLKCVPQKMIHSMAILHKSKLNKNNDYSWLLFLVNPHSYLLLIIMSINQPHLQKTSGKRVSSTFTIWVNIDYKSPLATQDFSIINQDFLLF